MSIGILYESGEWSNLTISEILHSKGISNQLIDVSELTCSIHENFNHRLYWNRIFPSAEMRNNHLYLPIADNFLSCLKELKTPLINSYRAYYYDFNKLPVYILLNDKGFNVPLTIGVNSFKDFKNALKTTGIPALLKRNRGGRAWNLKFIRNEKDIGSHNNLFPLSTDFWLVQQYVPLKYDFVTRIEIVGESVLCVLKRFLGAGGISSYSKDSSLEIYSGISDTIINDSKKALRLLDIEMGSLDIIESSDGKNYIIDVNATTNFTPDYCDMLGFNPLDCMCDYIAERYRKILINHR